MPEKMIISVMEIKLIVLTLLSWASRLALKSDLTIGLVIRQLILSLLIGVVAAEFVFEDLHADWIDLSIFCSAVFLADDIMVMVLSFGQYAKEHQITIFDRIRKLLLGK